MASEIIHSLDHNLIKHARDALPQMRVSILHRSLGVSVEKNAKEPLEVKKFVFSEVLRILPLDQTSVRIADVFVRLSIG